MPAKILLASALIVCIGYFLLQKKLAIHKEVSAFKHAFLNPSEPISFPPVPARKFTDGGECASQQELIRRAYLSDYAQRYNHCTTAEECVEYQQTAVNIDAIPKLVSCEKRLGRDKGMCDFSGGAIKSDLIDRSILPKGYFYPDSFECRKNRCVAIENPQGATKIKGGPTFHKLVRSPARTEWKLRYRKAMMDAMDPAIDNPIDEDCIAGIPEAWRKKGTH